jgi:hypothetical protein
VLWQGEDYQIVGPPRGVLRKGFLLAERSAVAAAVQQLRVSRWRGLRRCQALEPLARPSLDTHQGSDLHKAVTARGAIAKCLTGSYSTF